MYGNIGYNHCYTKKKIFFLKTLDSNVVFYVVYKCKAKGTKASRPIPQQSEPWKLNIYYMIIHSLVDD